MHTMFHQFIIQLIFFNSRLSHNLLTNVQKIRGYILYLNHVNLEPKLSHLI